MINLLLRTSAIVAIASSILASSPTISNQAHVAEPAYSLQVESTQIQKNAIVASVIAKEDDRAQKLECYFESKGSPFLGQAVDFITIADKYGLDWTLLPAIANLESQLGKQVPPFSYNPYGWNNGRMRFHSWIEATDIVAQGIRSRYAQTGEVTPYRIGSMYAESPTWAARVTRYQAEINTF